MVDLPGEPSRIDIVGEYIEKSKGIRLLEIGINEGDVICELRQRGMEIDYTGVDINIQNVRKFEGKVIGMDSRDFWKTLTEQDKWDVILIDGDHGYSTVVIDMRESKKHIPVGGFILCHDVGHYPKMSNVDAGSAFCEVFLADKCFSCSLYPGHTDGMAVAERLK